MHCLGRLLLGGLVIPRSVHVSVSEALICGLLLLIVFPFLWGPRVQIGLGILLV